MYFADYRHGRTLDQNRSIDMKNVHFRGFLIYSFSHSIDTKIPVVDHPEYIYV